MVRCEPGASCRWSALYCGLLDEAGFSLVSFPAATSNSLRTSVNSSCWCAWVRPPRVSLPFPGKPRISRAIPHADLGRSGSSGGPSGVEGTSSPRPPSAAAQPEKRGHNGSTASFFHAPAHRSWLPFRPQHPSLEPQDEAVPVRGTGRGSHHRPAAERSALAASDAGDPNARRRIWSRNTPSAAVSITSITVGWAARSPTGRPCLIPSSA
jgi:hypothetical protein